VTKAQGERKRFIGVLVTAPFFQPCTHHCQQKFEKYLTIHMYSIGPFDPYRILFLQMRLNNLNKALQLFTVATCLLSTSFAHSDHNQVHFESDHSGANTGQTWIEKYGPQIDLTFSGPLSFSHLPYVRCLQEESTDFDIAILGLPFDTGVSHRPG